jgi:osmotically-inducible protein OsmY
MNAAYVSRIVTGVSLIGALAVAAPAMAAPQTPQTTAPTTGTTVPPDDDALEAKIEDILRKDSVLAARDIDVEADRGKVTLTGEVRTANEKARAGRVAKVTGVTTVVNELEINPKVDASRIDTAASKTKEGLNKAVDATAKAADTTKKGVQRGVAETEKGLGTAADKTAGALDKTGDKLSDTSVSTRVKNGFSNDATLKNVSIRVEAKDRVVTLRGTVPSAAVKARAEEVAASTEGVVRVVNELVVNGK